MHYYDFNIKSYQAATNHLSNDEDLAYRRLLDFYYDTEKPIPNDIPLLTRRLRLGSDVILIVLKEFFLLSGNEWKHEYCDNVIYKYSAYLLKQKENGRKGGRNKVITNNDKEPIANPKEPTANPTLSQQETINNKPIIINNSIKEIKKENPFLLPDWIKSDDWDLWMKTRKGKKMIPDQMQKQVDKLRKWKESGQDYVGALEAAAINGYIGLFIPSNKAPPQQQRKQKFCSTELMYGMDGYGNKIKEENNERVINPI